MPQPAGGVDAVADCQVPANAEIATLGPDGVEGDEGDVGDVGVVDEELGVRLESTSHPAASVQASATATAIWCLAFMFPLSVRLAQICRDDMIPCLVAFEGVYSVLPRAFSNARALDLGSLRHVVDLFVSKRVNGLTALGATGEVARLDDRERSAVLETVIAAAAGGSRSSRA